MEVDKTTADDQDSGNGQVNQTPFIQKLYAMLEDPALNELIYWGPHEDSFFIYHGDEFSKVLCHYFRHTNIASFVRQLSMYGFHKVNQHSKESTRTKEDTSDPKLKWEFKHVDNAFKRNDITSLRSIKRRSGTKNQTKFEHHVVISNHDAGNYHQQLHQFPQRSSIPNHYERQLQHIQQQQREHDRDKHQPNHMQFQNKSETYQSHGKYPTLQFSNAPAIKIQNVNEYPESVHTVHSVPAHNATVNIPPETSFVGQANNNAQSVQQYSQESSTVVPNSQLSQDANAKSDQDKREQNDINSSKISKESQDSRTQDIEQDVRNSRNSRIGRPAPKTQNIRVVPDTQPSLNTLSVANFSNTQASQSSQKSQNHNIFIQNRQAYDSSPDFSGNRQVVNQILSRLNTMQSEINTLETGLSKLNRHATEMNEMVQQILDAPQIDRAPIPRSDTSSVSSNSSSSHTSHSSISSASLSAEPPKPINSIDQQEEKRRSGDRIRLWSLLN